jgi:SAM-dependent methyltransferase
MHGRDAKRRFPIVSFAVAGSAYDRFMGRYSTPLAVPFADFAGVVSGQHVLDVGCGPGALTAELVHRVGPPAVSAVDPSEPFVEVLRERQPEIAVQQATAEELPFPDETFDSVLAQLVVHFMDDPIAGLREMSRVAREGGIVAACVWDFGTQSGPLGPFWKIVRELDPGAGDESELAGTAEGDLTRLFHSAGLGSTEEGVLSVEVHHATFEDWWEPYTLGVGPAGDYVASLDDDRRERLRALCEERLPAPFVLSARAWATRART